MQTFGEVAFKSPLIVLSRDVTISSLTLNAIVKEFTKRAKWRVLGLWRLRQLTKKKGPPSLLKVSDETNLFGKKMTAPWEETAFQPFYNRNMSIKNI